MSGFSEFLERNVKDISYDFIGLVFPGLLINFSLFISLVTVFNKTELLEIVKNINSDFVGITIIALVLLAYFTGIVIHGLYCTCFKSSEKTKGNYINLIRVKFQEGYKVENYEIVCNNNLSDNELLRSALFIIQREGSNHYLSKYLAKRVMYRTFFLGAIILFLLFSINILLSNNTMQILSIMLPMIVAVVITFTAFFMIRSYTERIVKEIAYSILVQMKK